jgi:Dolichyl-phosphate-mannose-protein mannosyltransferase
MAKLALFLFICFLVSRIGLIPASSSGVDVWFSESAYWFLKTGVFRRPMHHDVVGSYIRDFYPPTPSIAQALSFSMFGINQFSMAVAPTLGLCLIILVNYWFARRLRASPWLAVCFSIAFLCVPRAFWYSIQVRYDIYVAIFTMSATTLAFLCFYENRPKLLIGTGFCLASAVISYYQFAPVAILLGVVSIACQRPSMPARTRILLLLLGALAPTLLFLVWIGTDISLFLHQNLTYATGYQFSQHWYRLISFGNVQLQALGCVLLIAISLMSSRSTSDAGQFGGLRTKWFVGLASAVFLSAMMAVYAFEGMLIVSALLAAQCLLLTQVERKCASLNLQSLTLVLMATLAFALVISTALSGLVGSGRTFQTFGRQIRLESNLNGIVLIDNPAWLALREVLPEDRLVHLIPLVPDASLFNKSTMLDDSRNSISVSTIIARNSMFPIFRSQFPVVAEFVRRPDVDGPIIIGNEPPYSVVIYRAKEWNPDSAN